MKIINDTLDILIACGWYNPHGYGVEVMVCPGTCALVYGPDLKEGNGEPCYLEIEGTIICQETPDDDAGYQVTEGHQLNLVDGPCGINVRYLDDVRIDCACTLKKDLAIA